MSADPPPSADVTTLLQAVNAGTPGALDRLLELVYEELRGIAAARLARDGNAARHQATELVNEVFVKLFRGGTVWENRAHMFGAAGRAMEQLLVDWARHAQRQKRGGGWARVPLDELSATLEHDPVELLAVSEALATLEADDPRKASVVRLRYFGGLGVDEVADALGVSPGTVKGDWKYARAWLHRELEARGTTMKLDGPGPS